MSDFALQREQTLHRLDSLCLALFNSWCEQRKLLPLAYLLHCWPLVDDSTATLRRLAAGMADLARYHADILGGEACAQIRELVEGVHDVSGMPGPIFSAAFNAVKGSGIRPRAPK